MTSDNKEQKKCGFCGETIPVGAGRCPYCGSILEVTFDHNDSITPAQNTAVNTAEGAKPDDGEQARVEQNAEVNVNTSESQDAVKQQEAVGLNSALPHRDGFEQQSDVQGRVQGGNRPYNNGGYVPGRRAGNEIRSPLSNGMKVFLTVLFTLIPGIGQLAGIITAIVFMNTEGDSDRKSFGVALLVASLIMFVFACIGCFILVIGISSSSQFNQFTY